MTVEGTEEEGSRFIPTVSQDADGMFEESMLSSYLDQAAHVERPWLEELADSHIADPNCRFVLVTGVPGSGKSAFMAWLARYYPESLRYFLRRDSIAPNRRGDVFALLESLGHQMAVRYPEAFKPARLAIGVRQDVGTVRRGGRLIGIRVDELVGSPFYATALRVSQAVGEVEGDVVGVEIGRIVSDVRLRSWEELEYLALTGPAGVVAVDRPDARIVIVIDALDEADSSGDVSILDWLATCPRLPSSLRIVVSSRPGQFLDRLRNSQARWLREISLDHHRDAAAQDVERYLESETERTDVGDALSAANVTPSRFVTEIGALAQGNFQYAVAYLRALSAWRTNPAIFADLGTGGHSELPQQLESLYSAFLSELRQRTRNRTVRLRDTGKDSDLWTEVVSPALGILSVARAPLTRSQVASYAKTTVDETYFNEGFYELEQFLASEQGAYRLYHASLADLLLRDGTGAVGAGGTRLSPAVDWNLRIAGVAYPLDAARQAMPGDDYQWRNSAAHLVGAYRAAGADLRELIEARLTGLLSSFDYLQGKTARHGVDALLADLRAAQAAFLTPGRELSTVALIVDKEAHELRKWNQAADLAGFAQLIQHRAVSHGMRDLAAAAADWLDRAGVPYLKTLYADGSATAGLLRTLAGHDDAVTALVALSADRVASAGADGQVMLWDITTGIPYWTLVAHSSSVTTLASAGEYLVTAAAGDPLRVWHRDTGESRGEFPAGNTVITTAVAMDASTVITGAADGRLRQWDIADRRMLLEYPQTEPDPVGALAVADGYLYAAYGARIRVWTVANGTLIGTIDLVSNGKDDPAELDVDVRALPVVDDRVLAVTANAQAWVHPGQLSEGSASLHVVAGRGQRITAASLAAGYLVSGSRSTYLQVETLQPEDESAEDNTDAGAGADVLARPGSRRAWVLAGHDAEITAVVVLPGETCCASGSRDGVIRVWDIPVATALQDFDMNWRSRKYYYRLPDEAAPPSRLLAASGGYTITTQSRAYPWSEDRYFRRVEHPKTAALTPSGWQVTFSRGPYGYYFKGTIKDAAAPYTIVLTDENHKVRHVLGRYDQATALFLTPAGRLVIGDADGTVSFWKGRPQGISSLGHATGWHSIAREAAYFEAHPAAVTYLGLLDDGSIVSGGDDGSLRRWKPAKWTQQVVSESPHTARILSVSETSSGAVVTADADGRFAVWDPLLTEVQILRRIESAVACGLGDHVTTAQGGSLQVRALGDTELRASVRLPSAVVTMMESDSREVTVSDMSGGHHQLRLIDPANRYPESSPRWNKSLEFTGDSIYAWPSTRIRLRYPIGYLIFGAAMAAIPEHDLVVQIFLGVLFTFLGGIWLIAALRNTSGEHKPRELPDSWRRVPECEPRARDGGAGSEMALGYALACRGADRPGSSAKFG